MKRKKIESQVFETPQTQTHKTCWKLYMPPSHKQELIFGEPWSRRQDFKITPHKAHQATLSLYLVDLQTCVGRSLIHHISAQGLILSHYLSVSKTKII